MGASMLDVPLGDRLSIGPPLNPHVMHVITGLGRGGAEGFLCRLVGALANLGWRASVVSLKSPAPLASQLSAQGVPVHCLDMEGAAGLSSALLQLSRLLRSGRPDIVQTWMYHADLAGGLIARVLGSQPIVWNLRAGALDSTDVGPTTRALVRVNAKLSKIVPTRIVCCSEASRRAHRSSGYCAGKLEVIANGWDLNAFRRDEVARASIRRELGIPHDAILIGLLARRHLMKGHRTFVDAARILLRSGTNAEFLLCGEGIDGCEETRAAIATGGMSGRFRISGHRSDMARVMSALDIGTLASHSEGCPNVVGEMMACEVPCVVTDVGDAAHIVGDTGRVVPPRDAAALAAAWDELIRMGAGDRARLGRAARERVSSQFSLQASALRYDRLYRELLGLR
jgi:glycosyltransferase involved in cell wall biosynthesis